MAFVNEITIEQKSLMPSYQKKWQELAFSINRIDRKTAIESVQSAYQLLELPMPEIQFFDSLYAAAKVAKPLYKDSYFTDDGFAHATELIAKLHEKLYINNEEAIGHWDSLVASELRPGDTQQIDRQLSESLRHYLSEGKSESFL